MEVKLIECPRDAMQGLERFINTDQKIEYINSLMQVGFDTLDCASFVNPRVIPQMRDSTEVINHINMTETKLSVIIANMRGALKAVEFEKITYLGYPFSVSETFQKRNTNSSIEDALRSVEEIVNLCEQNQKKFIAYISMGFGNSYGEPWSPEIVMDWIKRLKNIGVNYFSLSDTVGVSNPDTISKLISHLTNQLKDFNFGCHFHTREHKWEEKIEAAYGSGCRRFDGALKGFGGCPMADDHLVGNMPTEKMFGYFEKKGIETGLNKENLDRSILLAQKVFNSLS
ncbi:MAG: hydroxymethylglutaryl-CoA lyase [Flavobacteriales bacterium]|nr:hydroxymethylglutaryl-CoA lyase [Flavobacteriales bacterium]